MNRPNADAFFSIGKSHTVCQDYAIAEGCSNGGVTAIVCDGCSSSPNTDIGARLLARAALRLALWSLPERYFDLKCHEFFLVDTARCFSDYMGLTERCLDSTLLLLRWENSGKQGAGARAYIRGDGMVAARRRNGSLVFHIFDHPKNAPTYLSYQLDRERLENYRTTYTEEWIKTTYSDGEWRTTEGKGSIPELFFPTKEFDVVMVLSDGVLTFQRKMETETSRTFTSVPVEHVLEELFKIKGTHGKFLQRRGNKFLSSFCAEHDWQHTDDFSAAAFFLEEGETS